MSGHNKWSTIKHKKGRADAARGKLFTKLIKEITVAARMCGGAEDSNPRLRQAVMVARAANMPLDNIQRAIKKGTGELEGVSYEDITYEGYGPEGVALLIQCLTDNKNRCVSEIRHILARHNGKLAEPGSVAWIFNETGKILVDAEGADEDQLIEVVMDAGATDIESDDDSFAVYCALDNISSVRQACEDAGFTVSQAGLEQVPSMSVRVEGRAAETLLRLLDALENGDDVQNVWANFDMDDSFLESMA